MQKIFFLLSILLLTACGSVDIESYADRKPQLDFFEYFTGEMKAYGIVQDRSGTVTRQFVVTLLGQIKEDGQLVLEEDFVWNDGEISRRVWTITRNGNKYTGTASDVVGEAVGEVVGNSLHWNYDLMIEVDGREWQVHLDDWMYLQPDNILLNLASMSKFGLHLGNITLSFVKI